MQALYLHLVSYRENQSLFLVLLNISKLNRIYNHILGKVYIIRLLGDLSHKPSLPVLSLCFSLCNTCLDNRLYILPVF